MDVEKDLPAWAAGQPFAGKVAIVAGGAGPGMGRATAKLLGSLGAVVGVLDVNEDLGSETVERVQRTGAKAGFRRVDMTAENDVRDAMDYFAEAYGGIDLLFNNTGVASDPAKRLADFSLTEWERSVQVNLNSAFLGMKYAIPHMLAAGGGAIVNNASVSGTRANVGGAPYGVAKAGVIHLTKVAALEYGRQGIRVNCVCPYSISRKENPGGRVPVPTGDPGESADDLERWQRAQLPMLRSGRGSEVAHAVAFLLSDAASWVSGAALPVDGASGAGYFGSFR